MEISPTPISPVHVNVQGKPTPEVVALPVVVSLKKFTLLNVVSKPSGFTRYELWEDLLEVMRDQKLPSTAKQYAIAQRIYQLFCALQATYPMAAHWKKNFLQLPVSALD